LSATFNRCVGKVKQCIKMNVHWCHTLLKVSYYTIFTPVPEEPERRKLDAPKGARPD